MKALRERRDAGVPPFTVVSCDNVAGNGHVARTAVIGFASRTDPELAEWIGAEVAFPNSMVDRITPVMTDTVRSQMAASHGIRDPWPVRAESFVQWVLEDCFTDGRPPLEDVGVQLVTDVVPYELMKLRMLNASHQVMSHVGILAGLSTVAEACSDPQVRGFVHDYMTREATPTLPPVAGMDLAVYRDDLLARFGSTAVGDTLARQIVDASDRIPKFLLPVIRAQLQAGGQITHAALTLAAWSASLDPAAHPATPPVDRRLAELKQAATADREHPGAFLDLEVVFGDLGRQRRLRQEFTTARAMITERGVRAALSAVE